jgi:membrane-bound lytic murein transglycosylase D
MSNLTIAQSRSLRAARCAGVRVYARDWRLGALGASCTALGIACLMLVACSATPTRPPPLTVSAPEPTTVAVPPAPIPQSTPSERPAQPLSPWERIRRRFAMPGCDYNPAVRHWTRLYTQSASAFTASLSEAMPFLLVVLDEMEKRDVPGEFAFLPYIESTYTPIATSGDHAAGIWQLMPDTAREAGLKISADYDGRLDIYASTHTALDLLQRYHDEFGDWRISDMAFNAGEYGLKELVQDNRDDRTANEIGRLRVHAGTHDHLAKLLAVACVIGQPDRYKVELPDADSDDQLTLLELPAPVDLELAARLSDVTLAKLQHWNPGFLRGRMPANGPFHLLIPQTRRIVFERTLGKLPQYAWRDWHPVILKLNETIDLFASEADLDPVALATINAVQPDTPLSPGTRLLLPGRAANDSVRVDVLPAAVTARTTSGLAIVHAGDTLWGVARQQGIHVDDLMRWNRLTRSSTLHLGQRLRLSAPDDQPAGRSVTATAPAAN